VRQTLAFVPDSAYPSGVIGWLCVRNSDTYSDRPEMTVLYWPIEHGRLRDYKEAFPELDSDAELHGDHRGGYSLYRGFGSYSPVLRLLDGGSTKPVKTENILIPCPKVRKGIETRWRFGAWQKYLKSEGWVRA
jgi:hypothetical protein